MSYCGKIGFNVFQLTDKEIKELLDYFINRAGYISHEFDAPTHEIIKRMQKYERELMYNERKQK